MSRALQACAAGLLVLSVCTPADANWFTDLWYSCKAAEAQSRHWPMPYVMPDRAAVGAPFHLMVANGWRRQNLMGAHHFTPDGSQLSHAGEQKVRWILTQVPPHQRTIFIERGENSTQTARRVDTVQQMAVHIVPAGELPAVQESHLVTEGRPAAAVDRTNTAFQDSMPKPQLSAATLGSQM